MLPNLPLSAEKQHTERLRLKYCIKKETRDSKTRSKMFCHGLILRRFFLGIKNKETDRSSISTTLLQLKYLSSRNGRIDTSRRLSMATALAYRPFLRP